ncbi:MAG: AMIN domain-containing protein, partial [Rhizobiales bacterium]|nr:AMIN domain-containing protein [Hyphomicrobiales bacterium]
MTIGYLRRFALQLTCALCALAPPLAAMAAGSSATPVPPTPVSKKTPAADKAKTAPAKATGSIAAAAKAKAPAAPSATLGGDVTHTRFLIGLPKEVEYRVFSLSNPNRVIVDISETALQLPPQPEENIAVGLVRSFHAGRSAPGKSRVVIEVIRPVVVEGANIVASDDGKGHRLALDIVPVTHASGAAKKALNTATLSSLGAVDVQPPLPMPAPRPDELA